MLLAVDIGNTNIKLGLYDGARQLEVWRIATERQRLTDEYGVLAHNLFALRGYRLDQVRGCAIACVVPPLTEVWIQLARRYLGVEPLVLGPGVKTGMRLLIDTPRELGADRVAHAVAAYRRFGGPVIVIEFGTATVFDVISRQGDYIGGVIAPNIVISAEALGKAAARLFQVEVARPPHVIGKNTVQYMQSGIVYGYAGLVEGIVERLWDELGERATVVATGGLARLVLEALPPGHQIIDHVVDHLVLEGLRLIYELNQGSA
ncbi:type III pantothenate kinase [Kallotenue papyrolyticum]|uniref:type III pantothenate kinase n=1 Tax=Kallotenue papyrolyticum TaxID=1325125 RepID=UPI00046E8A88|nr:type III pantothenate kinase [Kallotenue papyrolyticum]